MQADLFGGDAPVLPALPVRQAPPAPDLFPMPIRFSPMRTRC
jgi:hypothetical protein